jgi:hypothetical protein
MEDLTPFNRCIELDPGTRKLMLDMIRSMKSLIPDNPALVPSSDYANSPFADEYVREIQQVVENHEAILSGISDPGALEKLVNHSRGIREIGDQIEKLLKSVRNYQNLASYLLYQEANFLKEHLEMVSPGNCRKADQVEKKMNKKESDNNTSRKNNVKLKVV